MSNEEKGKGGPPIGSPPNFAKYQEYLAQLNKGPSQRGQSPSSSHDTSHGMGMAENDLPSTPRLGVDAEGKPVPFPLRSDRLKREEELRRAEEAKKLRQKAPLRFGPDPTAHLSALPSKDEARAAVLGHRAHQSQSASSFGPKVNQDRVSAEVQERMERHKKNLRTRKMVRNIVFVGIAIAVVDFGFRFVTHPGRYINTSINLPIPKEASEQKNTLQKCLSTARHVADCSTSFTGYNNTLYNYVTTPIYHPTLSSSSSSSTTTTTTTTITTSDKTNSSST